MNHDKNRPALTTREFVIGRVVPVQDVEHAAYPLINPKVFSLRADKEKAERKVVQAAIKWFNSGYKDKEAAHLADMVEVLLK
jgi:hypothetical protein